MDRDELLMGLAAGFMLGQIDARSALPLSLGGGISVVGLLVAIGFGGAIRGIGVILVLLGIIGVLLVLLVRAMARAAIRKFAEPRTIVAEREKVERALQEADLPTGPLSSLRYITRFRRGLRPELNRLRSIFEQLDDDLGLDLLSGGPAIEGDDPRPELGGLDA